MATELIVNASLPETRIALMENGEIQEILIERAQGKGIVGNIYKGRVTRVLPGMQAAFVDIGLEKAAFLYVDDVFVHSSVWAEDEETEEGESNGDEEASSASSAIDALPAAGAAVVASAASESVATEEESESERVTASEADLDSESDFEEIDADEDEMLTAEDEALIEQQVESALAQHPELLSDEDAEEQMAAHLEEDDEDGDDDEGPVGMGAEGGDEPEGTISPSSADSSSEASEAGDEPESSADSEDASSQAQGEETAEQREASRRRRRGRRGGRNRRRREESRPADAKVAEGSSDPSYPESYHQNMLESGEVASDRAMLGESGEAKFGAETADESNRPTVQVAGDGARVVAPVAVSVQPGNVQTRPEFKESRSKDRKIRPKQTTRPSRMNINIQDLLKEGQEVIVQIAKDPIATKGARLTCHISLPGRHLVCMPTIDHVGVSRRIERDDERRRLREYVDRNRPKGLGFIVRTATSSGKTKAEVRIKQDIDYLSALWDEIKTKANAVTAPALVYEDLNPVLRAIRDWVNEDIDKIVVDSRYHYNDVQRFVRNFMPGIQSKIDLYQGDVPIFDAYGISTELARALERKVWLKSGGYLVIDQAEALVAIDVNTGRYVGKKNLEDTILKTNLEAVKEIAYQLRLRNCGGIIILDLIDMDKEENKLRVYRALEEELKKDRSRPQILKISELGLVEMTRKRTRDTMVRALCESCPNCEGKGYIKSKLTVAYEIMRDIERESVERESQKLLVQAHPDVIDTLAIDERESLDQLERRYKKQIYLQAVADLHLEQFEIVGDKRPGAKRSEESLLERARELAQTSDGRRGRRGRDRNRGKERGRDGNREGGSSDRKNGQSSQSRRNSNRDASETKDSQKDAVSPVNPNRPKITLRAGPSQAQRDGEEGPSPIAVTAGVESQLNGTVPSNVESGGADEDRLAYLRAQAAQDAALAAGTGSVPAGAAGERPAGKWGKGAQDSNRGSRGPRGKGGRRGRFQRGTKVDAPAAENGGQVSAAAAIPVSAHSSDYSSGDSDGGDAGGPS